MTLTSHAIVGAAIASFFPQDPALGFTLAFASHFALDAVPHFDYRIESASINPRYGAKMKYDKALLHDFFRIGGDALVGVILALAIFAHPGNFSIVLFGIAGAFFPDILQFVYMRWKHQPLSSLQHLHHWISRGSEYFDMNNRPFLGIISQFFIILSLIFLAKSFL